MLNLLNQLQGKQLLIVSLAFIITIIVSLTLHEFAHAFVAYKNGDQTPKDMGRVSINPLVHFESLGFVLIMLFGFGWAKPVPINPLRFRNYKKGMFLTSIAGVLVNITIAFLLTPLFLLFLKNAQGDATIYTFIYYLFYFLIFININLFVFNLIPIYPLDGFRVLETFTKNNNRYVSYVKQNGWLISTLLFVVLFQTNIISFISTKISSVIISFWSLII